MPNLDMSARSSPAATTSSRTESRRNKGRLINGRWETDIILTDMGNKPRKPANLDFNTVGKSLLVFGSLAAAFPVYARNLWRNNE